MSELVRCLREAVDEKNHPFAVSRGGTGAVDVVDADYFSGRSCDCSDAVNPVRRGIRSCSCHDEMMSKKAREINKEDLKLLYSG